MATSHKKPTKKFSASQTDSKKDVSKDALSAKDIEHYNAILIEDLKSQFNFVIEKVQDSETRITNALSNFKNKFCQRFDNLLAVCNITDAVPGW